MKIVFYSLLVLLVPLKAQLSFADNCTPWHNDFATKNNLLIGKIEINADNIFDSHKPSENRAIHRLANKIHIQTRPSVIKNQLVISEGDYFNPAKLAESERILRKKRYIKSASIKPYMLCGNRVNIRVVTHDNWTLTPGLTFSRQGSNNNSGIAIEENNLFGYGKGLSFSYKKDATRDSKLFSYEDPQLLGTRNKLSLSLQDNTDGKGYGVSLEHPFYEIDSKYSWGLNSSKLKQASPIYQSGVVIDKITEEKQNSSIFYGWSKKSNQPLNDNRFVRFKVGWTFDKTDFLRSDTNPLFQKITLQESYPWIELNSFRENYIKKTNYKTMGKIEDVNLGQSITVGIGLLHKSFGSDDNQLKISTEYSKGYQLNNSSLGFLSVETNSYIGSGNHQGNKVSFQGDLDHFNENGNDFSLKTNISIANNLTISEQLVLGGETGLRAFPTAYQTGNKSILVQAEKHIHFDWYPLHLFKFGAVFFADAGTAWGNSNNAKVMADVGVGLRLFPTRSSTGKTVNLNLAIPLTDRDKVKKYQISISTTQAF